MALILWNKVKKLFIFPYVDVQILYFNLSLEYRDKTDDKCTFDAIKAIKKYGFGIKCATTTPDDEMVKSLKLKKKWRSASEIIKENLKGTNFLSPVYIKNLPRKVKSWNRPIIIGK